MGIVRSISDALEPIEFPDSMTEADVDAYVSQNRDSLRAKLIARAQAQNVAETEAEETLKFKRGEMPVMQQVGSWELQGLQALTKGVGDAAQYAGRVMTQMPTPREFGEPGFARQERLQINRDRAAMLARDPEGTIALSPFNRAGKAVSEFAEEELAPLPGADQSLAGQVSSGLGSVGFMLPFAAVGGPVLAGTAYGLSAGQSAVDDVEQTFEPRIAAARNMGDLALVAALEQQKYRAKNIVGPVGAVTGGVTEGLLGVAGRVIKAGGLSKRIADRLADETAGRVQRGLAGAAGGFVTEAAQESSEQFIGNLAAKVVYDQGRDLTEGVVESAVVGGFTGGLVGGPVGAMRGSGGRTREVADPTPDNPLPVSADAVKRQQEDAEEPDWTDEQERAARKQVPEVKPPAAPKDEKTTSDETASPLKSRPSTKLSARSNSIIPPRPQREGRSTEKRDQWDESYGDMRRGGRTHNDDGTPYQPTVLDETMQEVNSELMANPDSTIRIAGVDSSVGIGSRIGDMIDAGWVWDATQKRMVNPQSPTQRASQFGQPFTAADEIVTPIPPDVAPGAPVLEEVALPEADPAVAVESLRELFQAQDPVNVEEVDRLTSVARDQYATTLAVSARAALEGNPNSVAALRVLSGPFSPLPQEEQVGYRKRLDSLLEPAPAADPVVAAAEEALAAETPVAPTVAPTPQPDMRSTDELIQTAEQVVRSENKASLTLLQRKLKLGYERAVKVMEELERRGVVGPSVGSESRAILPAVVTPTVAPAPLEAAVAETPAAEVPAPVAPDDTAMEAATLAAGQPAPAAPQTAAPDAGIAERVAANQAAAREADAAMEEATRMAGQVPATPAPTTAPEEGVQAVVAPAPTTAPKRPRIANKPQGPRLKGRKAEPVAEKPAAEMSPSEWAIAKPATDQDSREAKAANALFKEAAKRGFKEGGNETPRLPVNIVRRIVKRFGFDSELDFKTGLSGGVSLNEFPGDPNQLNLSRQYSRPEKGHASEVFAALQARKPVSKDAVAKFGFEIPDGYTEDGGVLTFKPESKSTPATPTQPDRILNALDAAIKATDSSGTVYSDAFLINALGRPLLNAALRAARAVYKATRQLAAARAAAWKHVQDNAPADTDLTGVKERLDAAVKPIPEPPPEGSKETEGWFKGTNPNVPTNSDARWTADAEAFVDGFNGDLQAAYKAAIQPAEMSGIDNAAAKYVMAEIMMRALKVSTTSKNPVEVANAIQMMKFAADSSKTLNSKAGADLVAAALIKEKLQFMAPILSYMGLIRKQQERLPFPDVETTEIRKWLKDARANAIKGVIADTSKADNVVAREFKKAARELKINWRDVMEASVKQQGKVKAAIAAEIRKHPELSKLSPEATVELANMLGRQWEQERNKILRAEFGRLIKMPNVKEDTKEKVFRALPKIIRLFNLGILDNEAFRNAVAPEFGVKEINQDSLAELNAMAQRAQEVGGVNRNRIIQDMYRKLAKEGGVSWGDILRDYWYASVLSGTRTMVDNMTNVLNGALNGMFLTMLSGKDAGTTARAWARGTKAGIKEFLPIALDGQLYLSKQHNPELSGSALEGISGSENLFKRALANGKFVSRLIIALDHITASGSEQAAISYALSRRFGKEELDRFMKPTKEVLALAKQRALNEDTPPEQMDRRIQEIVQETVPFEVLQVAADIRAESTYTERPKGLMGVFYDIIVAMDEKMEKKGYPRVLRLISGTQFARFAGNMSNAYLNYVPPVALLRYWRSNPNIQRMRWEANSQEQRNLLLMKAAFGTALAAVAAAYFLGNDDDEERDIDLVGTLKSLDPDKRKQLMAQGVLPYSIKIGDKYYSYRQMEFGGILAGIGELRDRQRWEPAKWNKETITEKFRDFAVSGMFIIKDSSAISGFAEFLGFANAYKVDPERLTEKSIPRFVSRLAGSMIPNIAKEIDAWGDPSLYKANTFTDFFLQQVPYWRREVGPGPMVNILGEPIRVERYPWSRWVREKPEDPEFQTLATLANRGVFLPMPAAAAEFVKGNERRPLTPEEMYQYETRVGKQYREFVRQNRAELLRLKPEAAQELIKRRTQQIRARELAGVRSKLKM